MKMKFKDKIKKEVKRKKIKEIKIKIYQALKLLKHLRKTYLKNIIIKII